METGYFLNGAWHGGVLDPQGPIGTAERVILVNATAIMLAVVVPVILLTVGFAWWFRAGNKKATYLPDWSYSGHIELVVWSIPTLVVLFLAGICWIGSHDLDPRRPIASETKPVDIDVVSLDWKWLFVYPADGVASVNRVVVPAGTPIYTMAGMTTRLNLQADRPGTYPGLSAQFSGEGFSDMRFDLVAMPADKYAAWIAEARGSTEALDMRAYRELSHAATARPTTYKSVPRQLFETIAGSPH
jgi:cytochrome o ubiquinol oxidase subunit 2